MAGFGISIVEPAGDSHRYPAAHDTEQCTYLIMYPHMAETLLLIFLQFNVGKTF
jgi:hypothetical protein